MERWVGRVVLVTGASSGIGAAIAKRLAEIGMKVVGCGRNVDRIQEFAGSLPEGTKGCLEAFKCDVSKEPEIISMFSHIKSNYGGVDVCINNAGLIRNSPILSGSTEDWTQMLNVNILALTVCTREAVQSMRERNVDDGHIINISSMSAHRVVKSPSSHFYGATKCAVRGITQGTRNELRDTKTHIRVTEISPALVETKLFEKMSSKEESDKMMKRFKCLEANDIADSVVYVLSAPTHVQVDDILIRGVEQVV